MTTQPIDRGRGPADGSEPPLSEQQMLLTAYVDGELAPADRARFEHMLADDPALALQAAQHKELVDLTRSVQLMEPSDFEARRFWAKFYNRGEWRLGWCMLIGGTLVLVGYALYELLHSGLSLVVKTGTCVALGGGLILLWNTVRLKLRTSRFDRYRGVMY
jgi:Putative zinc-finger